MRSGEVGATTGPTGAGPGNGDPLSGAAAVNRFGVDLLAPELGESRGNVALSPWSIATALGMVRAGALGTTGTEIDKVLHAPDPAAFHASMRALADALAARNGTFGTGDAARTVELSAADRAYLEQGLNVEAPFLGELARSYRATIGLVDFEKATESARREINGWVGKQTHDRIPELLGQGVLDTLTRFVLVDAVYLKADWQVPFDHAATAPAPFHAAGGDVSVPFMNGEGKGRTGDGWKSAVLPYAGGQLAMTVVLPDPGRFADVTKRLAADGVGLFDGGQPLDINDLSLPKFDFGSSMSLADSLARLGMPTAFTDRADFSAVTRQTPIQLSHVLHQANITVDEKGTVAAAATAVVARATAAPANYRRLVFDRPFLFLVRDVPTGATLFAGQVTDPARKG